MGELGRAFKMNIVAYDPYLPAHVFEEQQATSMSIDEVLKNSDYVTIHMPPDPPPDQRNLTSNQPTSTLRDEARRCGSEHGPRRHRGRGRLYEALRGKVISGAIIDAYSQEPLTASPLFSLDNVILSPHAGAFTTDALNAMSRMSVDQLFQYVDGATPDNLVTAE